MYMQTSDNISSGSSPNSQIVRFIRTFQRHRRRRKKVRLQKNLEVVEEGKTWCI